MYAWVIALEVLLEISPDSISEHLILKIFLGGMPQDHPSVSMLRVLAVLSTAWG